MFSSDWHNGSQPPPQQQQLQQQQQHQRQQEQFQTQQQQHEDPAAMWSKGSTSAPIASQSFQDYAPGAGQFFHESGYNQHHDHQHATYRQQLHNQQQQQHQPQQPPHNGPIASNTSSVVSSLGGRAAALPNDQSPYLPSSRSNGDSQGHSLNFSPGQPNQQQMPQEFLLSGMSSNSQLRSGYPLSGQQRAQNPQFTYQQQDPEFSLGGSAHLMAAQSGAWMPTLQQHSQQPSPSVDDLSQWSGPSHSSSRDEMWQSPPLPGDQTRQYSHSDLRSGMAGGEISDMVSLSHPSSLADTSHASGPRSSLADAQAFGPLHGQGPHQDSQDAHLPWLQAASYDGSSHGGAGASPVQTISSRTMPRSQQQQFEGHAPPRGQPSQGQASQSQLRYASDVHESPASQLRAVSASDHRPTASLTTSPPGSRSVSGPGSTSLRGQAGDISFLYNNFDEPTFNVASGATRGAQQAQQHLVFSDFDSLQAALNGGAALPHDRPASSHSSSTTSHPSSVISNPGVSEQFGNSGVTGAHRDPETSRSTLSNAFGPLRTATTFESSQSITSLQSADNHAMAAWNGDSHTPSGPSVRQRGTVDSLGGLEPDLQSSHDDLHSSAMGPPPFMRSNSAGESHLDADSQASLASLFSMGQRPHGDTATMQQAHGRSQSSHQSFLSPLASGQEGSYSQSTPHVQGRHSLGMPEGDLGRLPSAMPNSHILAPKQESQSSTPTIVEEEEDHGQASGRSGFLADRYSGSHMQQQAAGLPGHDRSGDSGLKGRPTDDLARRQQENELLMQMEQTGPQDARPNPYTDLALSNTGQIQMRSHPLQTSASAPMVLRRRYKPTVRPTTYQQLAMMSLGDDDQRGSMPGAQDVGATSDAFIDDIIRHYITCPSRLGLGERTVLIMTSRVAQKSYGSEKRFLCPPPMVLLIGSSWWNSCQQSHSMHMPPHYGGAYGAEPPTILTPPRVNIGMSGEMNNQDGVLEWATSSGRLIDVGNPSSEMAVSGRCIGKQLYISGIDERSKTSEMLVSLSVPGLNATDARLLGTFASKPIKIISKPSKKRQTNRNPELGILHGSIVSLFHRLRAQTVSTRYLCVSGAPTWFKGSDGQPFLTVDQTNSKPRPSDSPSCFVAKMTSWDPFVMYLVDPNKDPNDPNATPMKPPLPGYPPPPPSAMAMPSAGQPQVTVHYNQRIVLQCLNTAVVSPIMVIRKVEKASTVVGGAAAPAGSGGNSAGSGGAEVLGDPVSQLHKIALEVVEDPSAPAAGPVITGDAKSSSPGTGGPFLACLNESVGMRRPPEGRKWLFNQSASGSTPQAQSPSSVAAAFAAAQTRASLSQSRMALSSSSRPLSSGSTGSGTAAAPYPSVSQQRPPSSDGGKVKRPRRVSSSIVPQRERVNTAGSASGGGSDGIPLVSSPSGVSTAPSSSAAAKNRRRGQSLSVVEWQREQARQPGAGDPEGGMGSASGGAADTLPGGVPLSASWAVDIADSDVWTIVGTDIARHTFYIPPRLAGGVSPGTSVPDSGNVPDSGIAHLITTPAPSTPITPIPSLHSFVPPNHQDARPCVTLYGLNFTQDLLVYFGDWRSTHVEAHSPDTLLCTPPPPASEAFEVPNVRLPIILVRKDGVIFPTDCIYST